MTTEIFRPARLFALIRESDQITKVPVSLLGVGNASFQWGSYKEGRLTGFEIHGAILDLELELISLNEGEAKVQWDDISLNFTLFHLWLKGLSLDEREAVISDILSWQEEAHIRAIQEGEPLKKVA